VHKLFLSCIYPLNFFPLNTNKQGTLREQQEQWQRAVSDLQRREDLVDEWQRNHRLKEAKLEEVEGQFQLKASRTAMPNAHTFFSMLLTLHHEIDFTSLTFGL